MNPVLPGLRYHHAACHFAISAAEISRFSAVSRCKVPAWSDAKEREKSQVVSKSPKVEMEGPAVCDLIFSPVVGIPRGGRIGKRPRKSDGVEHEKEVQTGK